MSASIAMLPVIQLNPADNVAVARVKVVPGEPVGEGGLRARTEVPHGHKVAVAAIEPGQAVRKYGQVIGYATQRITPGEHVHLHNMQMGEGEVAHEFCADARPTPLLPEAERRSFQGYLRPDGQVGTRNYIGIITSVNCSATVARAVADRLNRSGELARYGNVDGIVALTHGGGCALGTQTEGYASLTRTLSGYARNPNFGAILMVGLGCETNQISQILERHALQEGPLLRTMTIQREGGTRRTIEAASEAIRAMLPEVDAVRRTTQPLSKLKLALECGGSDGYSGISANPALGHAADLLVQHGGTAVLAETPEIYGAEHLLTRRAASPEVARKLLERIEWLRDYTAKNGAELNNNPSHGNKAGGLTTILEKSLGAVAKGGSMPLEAV